MTGAVWKSGLVAALFATHPLHVESVAWVSERKDVLSALFFFLMLGAYVRYARAPSIWRYLLVTVLFAAGLISKPMLVSFSTSHRAQAPNLSVYWSSVETLGKRRNE